MNRLKEIYEGGIERLRQIRRELISKVMEVDDLPDWFPEDSREKLLTVFDSLLDKPAVDIQEAIYMGLRILNGEPIESTRETLTRINIPLDSAVYLAKVRWALEEGEKGGLPILIGVGATKSAMKTVKRITAARGGKGKAGKEAPLTRLLRRVKEVTRAKNFAGMRHVFEDEDALADIALAADDPIRIEVQEIDDRHLYYSLDGKEMKVAISTLNNKISGLR